MKLAELRNRIREARTGDSPQIEIALFWAFGAAFGGSGMVALLTAPPFAYGGPMSASPVWKVPFDLGGVLLVLSFVLCSPIGAVAGWRVGGFVHECATGQPNLAATLLFFAMLIPCVVGGAFLTLVMIRQDGISGILLPIAEVGVFCAAASVAYRVAIGRTRRHGDKPRGSGESAIDDRSTINDQP